MQMKWVLWKEDEERERWERYQKKNKKNREREGKTGKRKFPMKPICFQAAGRDRDRGAEIIESDHFCHFI